MFGELADVVINCLAYLFEMVVSVRALFRKMFPGESVADERPDADFVRMHDGEGSQGSQRVSRKKNRFLSWLRPKKENEVILDDSEANKI
jgi:hypothetical protein